MTLALSCHPSPHSPTTLALLNHRCWIYRKSHWSATWMRPPNGHRFRSRARLPLARHNPGCTGESIPEATLVDRPQRTLSFWRTACADGHSAPMGSQVHLMPNLFVFVMLVSPSCKRSHFERRLHRRCQKCRSHTNAFNAVTLRARRFLSRCLCPPMLAYSTLSRSREARVQSLTFWFWASLSRRLARSAGGLVRHTVTK